MKDDEPVFSQGLVSWGDVCLNILGPTLLIIPLMAAQVSMDKQTEFASPVELASGEKTAAREGAGIGEGAAYVTLHKDGSITLQRSGSNGTSRKISDRGQFIEEMRHMAPAKAYCRIDAGVTFGRGEELLLDCQSLGVVTYLAAREKADDKK